MANRSARHTRLSTRLLPRLAILPLCLLSLHAYAQTTLSEQINAVSAAQDREQSRQDAIARDAANQAAALARQQAAKPHHEHRHAPHPHAQRGEGRENPRHDTIFQDDLRDLQIALAKLELLKQQQLVSADKQRDQAYEDKLRDLTLQEKTLELRQLEIQISRDNITLDHSGKPADDHLQGVSNGPAAVDK